VNEPLPVHFAVVARFALLGVPESNRRKVLEALLALSELSADLSRSELVLRRRLNALREADALNVEFDALLESALTPEGR